MTPDELDDVIAGNVRATRARLKMSQEDLADEMPGWDRVTISRIESGRRRITFADVVALCGGLKVDLHQLLVGVDAETLRTLGVDRRGS